MRYDVHFTELLYISTFSETTDDKTIRPFSSWMLMLDVELSILEVVTGSLVVRC